MPKGRGAPSRRKPARGIYVWDPAGRGRRRVANVLASAGPRPSPWSETRPSRPEVDPTSQPFAGVRGARRGTSTALSTPPRSAQLASHPATRPLAARPNLESVETGRTPAVSRTAFAYRALATAAPSTWSTARYPGHGGSLTCPAQRTRLLLPTAGCTACRPGAGATRDVSSVRGGGWGRRPTSRRRRSSVVPRARGAPRQTETTAGPGMPRRDPDTPRQPSAPLTPANRPEDSFAHLDRLTPTHLQGEVRRPCGLY